MSPFDAVIPAFFDSTISRLKLDLKLQLDKLQKCYDWVSETFHERNISDSLAKKVDHLRDSIELLYSQIENELSVMNFLLDERRNLSRLQTDDPYLRDQRRKSAARAIVLYFYHNMHQFVCWKKAVYRCISVMERGLQVSNSAASLEEFSIVLKDRVSVDFAPSYPGFLVYDDEDIEIIMEGIALEFVALR